MKFRVLPCLLAVALPVAYLASGATPAPSATPATGATPAPGGSPTPAATPAKSPPRKKDPFLHRLMHPFEYDKKKSGADAKLPPAAQNATLTGFKQLAIGMQVDPSPVKLPDTKQVKVSIILINKGTKLVQLDFPTSQRIEVLVKGGEGKIVEQWSEDQAFNNEPTQVAINPGERVEYIANVATRDMVPGQAYSVEGFFPNFEQLRQAKSLTTTK